MTKTELRALRIALENKQVELGNGNWNCEALAIQRSSVCRFRTELFLGMDEHDRLPRLTA
jgi:hypothetical protein